MSKHRLGNKNNICLGTNRTRVRQVTCSNHFIVTYCILLCVVYLGGSQRYLIALKPEFRLNFWEFFVHEVKNIILCEVRFYPMQGQIQKTGIFEFSNVVSI